LERLISTPETEQRYRRARGKLIQRVLMKTTSCHVYYFHDCEHDLVEVHSISAAATSRTIQIFDGPGISR
jgi:hypothetical protein